MSEQDTPHGEQGRGAAADPPGSGMLRGLKGPGGTTDGAGAASTGPVTTFYEWRWTQAGEEMERPGVLVLGWYGWVTWHHAQARGSDLPGFSHSSPLISSVT